MTLHEEIANILREVGTPLNTEKIAVKVNQRKNYIKKDGSAVTPFQIHGRTKNYPNLFIREKSLVGLVNRDENLITGNKTDQTILSVTSKTNSNASRETNFENIDITKIEFLKKNGFIEIGSLLQLLKNGLTETVTLNSCGIYTITIPANYTPEFITPVEVQNNKNVINPWSIEKLETKWVKNVDIVYYGLAGSKFPRTLRARLNDLIKHGRGKTTDRGPHKGGEILWQLKGYENFHIRILPTGKPPVPRETEYSLLFNFYKLTGKLPFANRQF